jgi:hypothetical protein
VEERSRAGMLKGIYAQEDRCEGVEKAEPASKKVEI